MSISLEAERDFRTLFDWWRREQESNGYNGEEFANNLTPNAKFTRNYLSKRRPLNSENGLELYYHIKEAVELHCQNNPVPDYIPQLYRAVYGRFPAGGSSQTAEGWKHNQRALAELSIRISNDLGRLISLLEHGLNVDLFEDYEAHKEPENPYIDELLAVLKTAVAVLESPMVETGLLKSTKNAVVEIGKEAARKEGVDMVRSIVSDLTEALSTLISKF